MTRKTVAAVVVLLIAVAAGVGGYRVLYQPSQQPILSGPKPIPANKQLMMPVTPLGDLPQPERTRVANTLRDAAHAIEPGYRIEEEQMFVHPGGWDALRKLSGEYFRGGFGYRQHADSDTQVNGHSVDYLVWRGGWLRSLIDDRIVLAVEYFEPLNPGFRDSLLGYFVMRPGA